MVISTKSEAPILQKQSKTHLQYVCCQQEKKKENAYKELQQVQ